MPAPAGTGNTVPSPPAPLPATVLDCSSSVASIYDYEQPEGRPQDLGKPLVASMGIYVFKKQVGPGTRRSCALLFFLPVLLGTRLRRPSRLVAPHPSSRCTPYLGTALCQVLLKMLREDFPHGNDFGRDMLTLMVGMARIKAFPHTSYWEDVGTLRSFYRANLELARDVRRRAGGAGATGGQARVCATTGPGGG